VGRSWYLVCYDVRDARRLRRAHGLLKGYGASVQYSIFRCRLSSREVERLRWELQRELAPEDSLVIIGVCGACEAREIEEESRFAVL
jgi:CRISPR-associated protein Cas2